MSESVCYVCVCAYVCTLSKVCQCKRVAIIRADNTLYFVVYRYHFIMRDEHQKRGHCHAQCQHAHCLAHCRPDPEQEFRVIL